MIVLSILHCCCLNRREDQLKIKQAAWEKIEKMALENPEVSYGVDIYNAVNSSLGEWFCLVIFGCDPVPGWLSEECVGCECV